MEGWIFIYYRTCQKSIMSDSLKPFYSYNSICCSLGNTDVSIGPYYSAVCIFRRIWTVIRNELDTCQLIRLYADQTGYSIILANLLDG